MRYLIKYRLAVSAGIALILGLSVVFVWSGNVQRIRNAQKDKVEITSRLLTGQISGLVTDNVNKLENLKRRIEVTGGDFFPYWEKDASFIIEQEPTFLFVEWINDEGQIELVNPVEGNEEAIGLNILTLDYRSEDWNRARTDSVYNLTHWLALVQGDMAFLVDAPVFLEGEFIGTITAGMDFTKRLNEIFGIFDDYHIEIRDERSELFYSYGDTTGNYAFRDMSVMKSIMINDANNSTWQITLAPNYRFAYSNLMNGYFIGLILVLGITLLLSLCIYYFLNTVDAESESKEANEKLRALIESSPVGIYVIDQDGIIRDFWNDAAEKILGWKKEEVMGQFIPHVSEGYLTEYFDLMKSAAKKGAPVTTEVRRKRKDGRIIDMRLNLGSMLEDENESKMLVLIEDISKEKDFEEQVKRSLKEKEVLLTEIHHRVKNNLAIIVGLIELQKEGQVSKDVIHMFEITQNRIYSIAEVHELLYSTENFSEIKLKDYMSGVVKRLQNMYGNEEGNVDVQLEIDETILNINQGIPLGLLLNELLTNSYKHAFNGSYGGMISIEMYSEEEFVYIRYSDNGVGMDEGLFKESSTMGITIIHTLLHQLSAGYELKGNSGFDLRFSFQIGSKGAHSNL